MGSRTAAATPALAATAVSCSRLLLAVTVRRAASCGKATLPIADTSGTGTRVAETAMA